jgi:hypothetical protein
MLLQHTSRVLTYQQLWLPCRLGISRPLQDEKGDAEAATVDVSLFDTVQEHGSRNLQDCRVPQ